MTCVSWYETSRIVWYQCSLPVTDLHLWPAISEEKYVGHHIKAAYQEKKAVHPHGKRWNHSDELLKVLGFQERRLPGPGGDTQRVSIKRHATLAEL